MIGKIDEFFRNKYYRNNVRFACAVGIWPYQATSTKLFCFLTALIIAESTVIPQLAALVKIAQVDVVGTLECVPTIIIGAVCGMKLINSAYNNDKIKIMLDKVMADWSSLTTEKEVQILRTYSERTRRITIGFAYLVISSSAAFVILPFLSALNKNPETADSDDEINIPYEVEYFIDTKKYYYLILIHICMGIAVHMIILVAVDSMFSVFVQHICAMFAILSYRLEHSTDLENVNEDPNSKSVKNRIHRNIANCILKHNELLNFADLIESTYSTFFLLQLGFNMIVMSVTAVQALLNADVFEEFIRHLASAIAQLVHLFLECWQAQQLIDHSNQLYESIGKIEWYRTSKRSKKLIVIMLMRTFITCRLTAGKIIVLCFETFTSVVSKSMSYFTVLRTMQ